MRRIEAASLLPDLSIHYSNHAVPCTDLFDRITGGFARGTLLDTRDGPMAIEDLMPGDFVESSEGAQPILWIGSTMIAPGGFPDMPAASGLIRVMPQSFGVARPTNDVLLGPWAGLLHNPPQLRQANGKGHVLTPLKDFIDGDTVVRVTPPSAVRVYHIVLRRHAAVRVSGLEVETYHPGPGVIDKLGQNGLQLFLSLFPHVKDAKGFGPLGFPRVDKDLLDGLSAA
ncbi:Hint domain-containing protein [Primorskyibacter aestuariivivens]|uniref:Hint domain-containing protein n=1 Tax=Primorskyibacter aestuariivivens TaxID=1888912 RepID=UPI002301C865|nr:Hint domain-containing protein [Primorskyibacter aestuariivivens]MDA7428177.1 Hint domain-containing protein [Primorskyibacter aestuariivivens]